MNKDRAIGIFIGMMFMLLAVLSYFLIVGDVDNSKDNATFLGRYYHADKRVEVYGDVQGYYSAKRTAYHELAHLYYWTKLNYTQRLEWQNIYMNSTFNLGDTATEDFAETVEEYSYCVMLKNMVKDKDKREFFKSEVFW